MGYDYRRRIVEPGRLGRADRWPVVRRDRHGQGVCRSHPGVQGHPRACRTTAAPGRPTAPRSHARNISGTKNGSSVTVVYGTAHDYALQHGRKWDAVEGVAWTSYQRQNCTAAYGCVNPWREIYYDDAQALGLKYDVVNRYNLRGAGIWALGYDGTRPELYQVLKDKFVTDTIPPRISGASLSTPIISPNGDGRLDTTTMRVNVTGHVKFGWIVQPVDGRRDRPCRSHRDDDRQAGRLHLVRLEQRAASSSRTVATGSRSGPRTPRTIAPRSRATSRSIGGAAVLGRRPPRRPSRPTATADPIARPSGCGPMRW